MSGPPESEIANPAIDASQGKAASAITTTPTAGRRRLSQANSPRSIVSASTAATAMPGATMPLNRKPAPIAPQNNHGMAGAAGLSSASHSRASAPAASVVNATSMASGAASRACRPSTPLPATSMPAMRAARGRPKASIVHQVNRTVASAPRNEGMRKTHRGGWLVWPVSTRVRASSHCMPCGCHGCMSVCTRTVAKSPVATISRAATA